MRSFLIPTLTATALAATAMSASAQADRYGGYAAYPAQQGQPAPQPMAAPVPAQPSRILSWPGKTIPVAQPAPMPQQMQPQPQAYAAPYGYPAPPVAGRRPPPYAQQGYGQRPYQGRQMYPASYAAPRPYAPGPQQPMPVQAQPAPQAAPQLRPTVSYTATPPMQGRPYPGQAYPTQPYYAPAAPMPAPGSTATAPNGVYPAGVVPPQLVYPMGVQPQMNGQIVGPQSQQQRQPPLPTSIYAPPPPTPQASAQPTAANPTDPRQPQRVAMNTAGPAQSARLYSVHREFGMSPDRTPVAAPEGQVVQLVSPIDSAQPDPDGDVDRAQTRRVTDTSGKTTVVRSRSSSDD